GRQQCRQGCAYTPLFRSVADESSVKAGGSTSFTLTITNDGPSAIEAGKAIELRELPGEGVTITGYDVLSGAATVSGSDNSATVSTDEHTSELESRYAHVC